MQGLQHNRPLSYGLVAAALAPWAAITGYALISSLLLNGGIFVAIVVGIFSLVVSVTCSLVLGAPYVLVLRHFGMLHAGPVCLGASAAGALGLWAINYHLSYFPAAGERAHEMAASSAAGALLPGALFGLFAGVSFCIASGVAWWRAKQA